MKKTITLKQLANLVKEGTAPRRRAGRATEKFTVRYTNNNQACDAGPNSYFTAKVDGPLNNALNFCAYFMTMGMAEENGSLSRKQYQEALQSGDWEVVSDEEAIQAMDDADVTQGCPVIFWIKDATGTEVYVYEYGEEDFKSWDAEGDEGDVEVDETQVTTEDEDDDDDEDWDDEDWDDEDDAWREIEDFGQRYDAASEVLDSEELWDAFFAGPEQEIDDKLQVFPEPSVQFGDGVVAIFDEAKPRRWEEPIEVDYTDWTEQEGIMASSSHTEEEYQQKYEAYLRSLIPALGGGAQPPKRRARRRR